MTGFRFFVEGTPVPKARARVAVSKSGKAHAYTPARTEQWENTIKLAFRSAFPGAEPIPANVPITVMVAVWAPGRGPRCKIRGDVDNFVKSALDALQGEAFVNDIQVVDQRGIKDRARRGGCVPGMVIEIQEAV